MIKSKTVIAALITSGAVIFAAIISLFNSSNDKSATTKGDHSPAVIANGDVNIMYGISEESINELRSSLKGENKDNVINRLLKTLDEKDIALEHRDSVIRDWVEKYHKLESELIDHSADNILILHAKEKLRDGDLEAAEQLLITSLNKNQEALTKSLKAAAENAYYLASLKRLQFDYVKAKEYYKQAVQLEPQSMFYHAMYGLILDDLGEYKEALIHFKTALKLALTVYKPSDFEVALFYEKLGFVWNHIGNYEESIRNYNIAVDIINEYKDTENKDIDRELAKMYKGGLLAKIYNGIGAVYLNSKQYENARDILEKSKIVSEKLYGNKDFRVAIVYSNLGLTWDRLGEASMEMNDFIKAKDYYNQALAIYLNYYSNNDPTVGIIYENLAALWVHLKDKPKAVQTYRKALNILQESLGNNHPHTQRVNLALNDLLNAGN